MRSRHKGVVDDCAICFNRITACCMANGLRDVVYQYLEKVRLSFLSTYEYSLPLQIFLLTFIFGNIIKK